MLIHDVWGVSDHTRDVAGRLAREGFSVLAVDLYTRLGHPSITDPGAFMRELSDPDVLADVATAVAALGAASGTPGPGVGVVGFCMGGTYALLAGCGVPGVAAVAPFYGILSHDHGLLHAADGLDPACKPRSPLAAAAELQCPLLGFFGAEDEYVPEADVRELERRVAGTGQPTEVRLYAGAGHAFFNDTREGAYRAEAAADAWTRLLAFLRLRLKG
ncbi:MAG: dienelactone hydrolase family protein [Proteobacteria bacterium]|nr:dienelactone hydrolase family protein [Pseudomonadota bacterium]